MTIVLPLSHHFLPDRFPRHFPVIKMQRLRVAVLSEVTMTASLYFAANQLAHKRPFAPISVPAAAEHGDDLP